MAADDHFGIQNVLFLLFYVFLHILVELFSDQKKKQKNTKKNQHPNRGEYNMHN